MLLKVSVKNFKSFDKREELSLISSTKIRDHTAHKSRVNQVSVLKHAVIYGANASGKSNLVAVVDFVKAVLQNGLLMNSNNDFCRNKEENRNRESFFELQFSVEDRFYAYGFSAVLHQRKITEEWLFELLQNGSSRNIFLRNGSGVIELGDGLNLSAAERNRFTVYAEDFAGHDANLFLAEMNRGKKYTSDSRLSIFPRTYNWISRNIIVLNPYMGISNSEMYYNQQSLDNISRLIQSFDTGVSQIKVKTISAEELSKRIPAEVLSGVISSLKQQMQAADLPQAQVTWRLESDFINIRIADNAEPEITTLVLRHGKSLFDFDFSEESDGTKRLFDLIDMLLTNRADTVFVVDELERSLHPKLTERFLKLFMEAHGNSRTQLIFTTHEDTVMDQELFRRDEIWFVERDADNASTLYSLDRFKERYDKRLSKAYLEGRYGAIPVFRKFSFRTEE